MAFTMRIVARDELDEMSPGKTCDNCLGGNECNGGCGISSGCFVGMTNDDATDLAAAPLSPLED